MPINKEDKKYLSGSNMLLKILSLSKFPFHFKFCDTFWPLLLSTQTCSNFILRKTAKNISFLYAVKDILETEILKSIKHAQGYFHRLQVKSIT